MERPIQRPRIADVAREAGVSKTAVSFAFNNPGRLASGTAMRIREVAENLGYRPDPVARMLAQRRTMTLGVLTPQPLAVVFSNPFFALFGEGVADAADARGYDLRFVSPRDGSLATGVRRATVDGVVALGLAGDHPEVEQIRASGLPMVLVDSADLPEHSSVVVDDEGGARAAAAHLAGLGHRDVLVVAVERPTPAVMRAIDRAVEGSADPPPGVADRRFRGYRAGLATAGIELRAGWVVAGRASIDGGEAAFREAWASGRRPTGVLAMGDAMAIGVMRAARVLGLDVPGDLSVVGFDDIDLAGLVEPGLSTVHQPIRQKGVEAVRLLLAEIEGGPARRPEHVRLDTGLVIRGSTGPAARA